MDELRSILKKYWGHSDFRGNQLNIIQSVMEGKDTLGIMPTGGGKSICFQVPALAMQKTGLVISPLVALMKDQVDSLLAKGIKAYTIHSGMSPNEIDICLDNVIYNKADLLYVAPERIQNHLFQERLKKMEIGLVAVDEAHCISQWGHDFRPSYLNIPQIKEYIQGSFPLIALTASATPKVEKEITELLELRSPNIHKRSSKRSNLSLSCYAEENKMERVIKALNNVPGSALIYVRNRRKTKEIANELNHQGFNSTYFHAGLGTETKFNHQENWKSGKTRIMVCTNAFGMGIDKEDVRLVVHYDLPDSIEAYYQEVGRAGRDEKLSFGLTVFNPSDIKDIDELIYSKYPDIKDVINVYNSLGNFYKLALGSGESQVFDLPIERVCYAFDLNPIDLIRAMGVLEKLGLISYIISQNWSSTLHFRLDSKEMYRFQVENPKQEPLIKSVLRTYGGELFTQYVSISEQKVSKASGLPREQLINGLRELNKRRVLDYNASKPGPKVIFLEGRTSESSIKERFNNTIKVQKKGFGERVSKALEYYKEARKCRMALIQEYFGEEKAENCGKCDNCIASNKKGDHPAEMEEIINRIKVWFEENDELIVEAFLQNSSKREETLILEALRLFLNNGKLKQTDSGSFIEN